MLRPFLATRKSNQGLTGLTFGLTLLDRVKFIANTRYYGVPVQRMNVQSEWVVSDFRLTFVLKDWSDNPL